MIGTGKPIKFILAWQTYQVGDEIDPPALDRGWLIANGYCVEVEQASRPAAMTRKAAKKVAEGVNAASKVLFG
jgi:hypothetical protein